MGSCAAAYDVRRSRSIAINPIIRIVELSFRVRYLFFYLYGEFVPHCTFLLQAIYLQSHRNHLRGIFPRQVLVPRPHLTRDTLPYQPQVDLPQLLSRLNALPQLRGQTSMSHGHSLAITRVLCPLQAPVAAPSLAIDLRSHSNPLCHL